MTVGSVGKITFNLSPRRFRASAKQRREGVDRREGSGVTLADSRICPVSGQATCYPPPAHWFFPL